MSAYWDARAAARDKVYDRAADRAVLVTKRAVENAMRTLKTEMADILRVFAKRFDLTRDEAQTLLAAYADEETQLALQKKIAQLVQTGDGNALRMLKAQVDAKAYAARLSRAQAMHDAIVVESVKVAQVEQEACRTALQDVYIQGNSRMMFDIQKDAGRMFGWTAPSVSQAMETLRQRWAGGNYAARIWQNAEKLALDLESAVMENVLSGKTSESTYQALLEAAEGHMPTVNRLIRTETVYVANQAEKDAYEEAGIDQYRYVARLEARTCEKCGKLDGEVFPVYKGRTGTNLPPMHPWCRCTTEPADDVSKMLRGKGKRWSTDPVTGEDVYVPDDMTYGQWKLLSDEINGKIRSMDGMKATLPDGNEGFVVNGGVVTDAEVFAGYGSNRELRVKEFLVQNYGGDPALWSHTKGHADIKTPDGQIIRANVHWFEAPGVGIRELRVKGWSKK